MKTLKDAPIESVLKRLVKEMNVVNHEIRSNKIKFKKLVEEQTTLKRERVVLQGLINQLQPSCLGSGPNFTHRDCQFCPNQTKCHDIYKGQKK